MLLCTAAAAEPLRVATFHASLSRKGPGLLLRDVLKGEEQAVAAAKVIERCAPDILLLTGVDHDHDLVAARAFRDLLAQGGLDYAHLFARRPNSGRDGGIDLDGDGRLGEPEDSLGYGAFTGQGGMLLLSRWPIDSAAARDFNDLLWRDLPGQIMPDEMDAPVRAVLPLSSVGHWVVPVLTPDGPLTLMAFHAQTPVFDGPEDRNGRRNADEIRFWRLYLDGAFGNAPQGRFVILGNANLDPKDGDGRREAIRALVSDPRLQNPHPASPGAEVVGDRTDTVDWPEPKPGNLRVSYVLPSADLTVHAAGVDWPAPGDAGLALIEAAGPHRLVWVDLDSGGS